MSADIKEMDGEVVSRISAHTTICISTQSEVDSMGRPMKGVEKWDVPVVDEGYLEGVAKGADPLGTIASHTISSWGAPRNKLPCKEDVDLKKSKIFETGLSLVLYIIPSVFESLYIHVPVLLLCYIC